MPAETVTAIRAASASSDTAEASHEKHLRADGTPRFTNRIILETSPYLRQHAHNPVNWYWWSDEAFAAARRL